MATGTMFPLGEMVASTRNGGRWTGRGREFVALFVLGHARKSTTFSYRSQQQVLNKCFTVLHVTLLLALPSLIVSMLSLFLNRNIEGPAVRKEAPHLSQDKSKQGLGELYEKEVRDGWWLFAVYYLLLALL